jgi:hypothetical protein
MGDPDDPVGRALFDLDESWNEEVNAQVTAARDEADRDEADRDEADLDTAEHGAAERGVNDRTIAGLGVGTPQPMPAAAVPSPSSAAATSASGVRNPFAHMQPRPRKATQEPQQKLVQPEQSPLSFVLRASESSSSSQRQESHDMSVFVAGLVADTSPVVDTEVAVTAMEPVMRKSRKRRQWLVAGAIAATAIAGTVLGMLFAGGDDPPKVVAKEVAEAQAPAGEATAPADVEPTKQPEAIAQAPTAPTVEAPIAPTAAAPIAPTAAAPIAPTAAAPTVPPTVEATPPTKTAPTVTAAISKSATTARPATKTTTKATPKTTTKPPTKKAAPKKVATAKTTAKQPAKKPAAKPAVAKKTTAKKPTPAKKPTKPTTKKTRR